MIFEKGDRILFAGDSVTDMGSNQPIGELNGLGNTTYVTSMHCFLTSSYPELKLRLSNAGHSGATTRSYLINFDSDVLDPAPKGYKPNWVSICLGINDVWSQFASPVLPDRHVLPDEYEANLEEMIRRIRENLDVKGIFIATPFMIESCKEDAMRKRMDEYGAICKKVAEKHGCILVDFQAAFDEFLKHYHSAIIALDRIHPNFLGAHILAKAFLKKCDFDFTR